MVGWLLQGTVATRVLYYAEVLAISSSSPRAKASYTRVVIFIQVVVLLL
jgi:hypothetical protein